MHTRRDNFYTVVTDQDLHDRPFTLAHYLGNSHVDLTLPLSWHEHRTIHLGAHQCRQWGLKLIEMAESIKHSNPKHAHDFTI
jgi:hypothetical protein